MDDDDDELETGPSKLVYSRRMMEMRNFVKPVKIDIMPDRSYTTKFEIILPHHGLESTFFFVWTTCKERGYQGLV